MTNSNLLSEILLSWLGQIWYGLFLILVLALLSLENPRLKGTFIITILAAIVVPLFQSPVALTLYLLGWLLVIIILTAKKQNKIPRRRAPVVSQQEPPAKPQSLLQKCIGEITFCFTNTIILWPGEIKALCHAIKHHWQNKRKNHSND